jgi:hypothetical protein
LKKFIIISGLVLIITGFSISQNISEDISDWGLTRVQIDNIPTDGIQKADITGDGKWELVLSGDKTGKVYWYRQLRKNEWQRYEVATGFQDIEGVDAGDLNGDGSIEIVIVEQRPGRIAISKMDTSDPEGHWSSSIIDADAPMAQSSFLTDVSGNGFLDIIYTYDGRTDGEGGIYWLENHGNDPMDVENWTKHEILQINGAHGLHDGWVSMPGFRENGAIVASTRLLWNENAEGEVFWLERPDDPRLHWIKHTIVHNASRHITVGDFNGNGQYNDVFTIRRDQGEGLYWYELNAGNEWIEHVVTTEGKFRTISSHDLTGNGVPEVIVTEYLNDDAVRVYQKQDDGVFRMAARHPYLKSDDRIVYFDIDGDGRDEFITSSEINSLDYWIFELSQSGSVPVVRGYGQGLFQVGELLYSDQFANLENWVVQIQDSDSEIEAHIFAGDSTLDVLMPDRGATIWNKQVFSGPITIMFNVVVPSENLHLEGVAVRDINCFWHATDTEKSQDIFDDNRYTGSFISYHKQQGYYASMGGNNNTTTRFRRYPRTVKNIPVDHISLTNRDGLEDYLVQSDREYTIQLVVYDDVVQYIVDGKIFYEIREGDSITIETSDGSSEDVKYTRELFAPYTEGRFGFRLVRSHHKYSNFRVYRLEPTE